MRIRTKPWAKPELAACPYFVAEPKTMRGKWVELYPKKQPLHLEIGCGKGGFISGIAPQNLHINYLSLDIRREMVAMARRKVERAYALANLRVDNLQLTLCNADFIHEFLSPEDGVERIYLNFSNPWPKSGHHKRRLSHPRFLEKYATFLLPEGQLHLKTDDLPFFEASLSYLEQCGWKILDFTRDLHATPPADNIMTEHEKMFLDEGKPICGVRAMKIR